MAFSGMMWGCPACHRAYSNDEVRGALIPSAEELERLEREAEDARFDPWLDEQRLKRQLIPEGSHSATKGRRRRKGGGAAFVPWYQQRNRGY